MNKIQIEALEAKAPETVLLEMAQGGHGSPDSQTRIEVESWLRSKQVVADAAATSKRDAREESTLAIAKEANRLASEANSIARLAARSAKYAAIIAAIAAIAAIIFPLLTKN